MSVYGRPNRWERQLTPKYYLDEWKDAESWKRRLEILWKASNRVPVWTYPEGVDAYWDVAEDEGLENWRGRHNLWRQAWHFIAGAALGWLIPYQIVAAVIAIKEAKEAYTKGALFFKNIVDLAVWTTGAWIGGLI